MILRICNSTVTTITDGGSSRDLALSEFVQSVGGTVLIVRDEYFYRTRAHRILRVIRLLREVWRSPHRFILLYYPGYPFFWNHKVTFWFLVSVFVTIILFLIGRVRGKRTIVDVVDLPLHQYRDLLLPMEMSERTFHRFDRLVFGLADEVWFASSALAALARHAYGLSEAKVRDVLNGAFRVTPGALRLEERPHALRPLRFVMTVRRQ